MQYTIFGPAILARGSPRLVEAGRSAAFHPSKRCFKAKQLPGLGRTPLRSRITLLGTAL